MQGTTPFGTYLQKGRRISIHVPIAGNDSFSPFFFCPMAVFQSTFPLQGTTFFSAPIVLPAKIFQSTFPLQGTTEQIKPFIEAEVISIHVPIAGNDTCDPTLPVQKQNFNPRSHCRERHNVGHCSGGFSIFQSTFPLQGTTTVSMHMIGLP